jgi:hypothetical protein
MRPRREQPEQADNGRGRLYALSAFCALLEIELLAQ